jgi:hypothetical protein
MCTHDVIVTEAVERSTRDGTSGRRGLLGRLSDWVKTCADYYAASAMYEELSRLSDAELHRRGLTRESLARHVCAATDRTSTSR